jgi:hypothetical protein
VLRGHVDCLLGAGHLLFALHEEDQLLELRSSLLLEVGQEIAEKKDCLRCAPLRLGGDQSLVQDLFVKVLYVVFLLLEEEVEWMKNLQPIQI